MPSDRHRILVMRHAQTVANVTHVLSGRSDVDLTPEGEHQMFRAIDALVAWAPDRIWTSPLSRCKAIGEEAAARLGVECEVNELLSEIEFGSVQGMTVSQVRDLEYDFPWQRDAFGASVPAPGAESFEDVYGRAYDLLDELFPLTGRTACITHGGFTRALLGAVYEIPLTTFWNVSLPNVSSQVLTCDGECYGVAALGLAPEEVVRRAKNPELIGNDTIKNIAEE